MPVDNANAEIVTAPQSRFHMCSAEWVAPEKSDPTK
jgi:hypothetical protein